MPGILRRRESDSDEMIELESDDFPSYFIERRGRLFSSNPTPYILPVDTPEQEVASLLVLGIADITNTGFYRGTRFFTTYCSQIHGNNYVGPVPEVLEMDSQRQKRVLDVCTGNGIWYLHQDLSCRAPY
jgi:hypothetical protein